MCQDKSDIPNQDTPVFSGNISELTGEEVRLFLGLCLGTPFGGILEWGPLEKLGVPELVKNQFAPEKENFPLKEHFVQLSFFH